MVHIYIWQGLSGMKIENFQNERYDLQYTLSCMHVIGRCITISSYWYLYCCMIINKPICTYIPNNKPENIPITLNLLNSIVILKKEEEVLLVYSFIFTSNTVRIRILIFFSRILIFYSDSYSASVGV